MADPQQDHQVPIAAVAIVAVIVVLAVIGGVLWFTRNDTPEPAPTAATTPAGPPTGGTTSPPTQTPAASRARPKSSRAGRPPTSPACTSRYRQRRVRTTCPDGLARDFERSELGAVMAAAHLRLAFRDTPRRMSSNQRSREQVVDGDNADRLLSLAMATYDEGVEGAGPRGPSGPGRASRLPRTDVLRGGRNR